MKIHRWQPTGFSPCGRWLDDVAWNEGKVLQDGVTCLARNQATTLTGHFPPRPHPIKETPHV